MTDRELLEKALEALEEISGGYSQNLIAALRERLAQPEQEPVAIVAEVHMSRYTIEWTNGPLPEGTKLYTTPPQRKPLTEEEIFSIWRKHTDLDAVRHTPYEDDGVGFARAIEAAHGIKENT